MDHSWYHSLKGLPPILEEYIAFVVSNLEYAGTKCFLNFLQKSSQLSKSMVVLDKAAFWTSWAHSLAEDPTLKFVSAEETLFPSSEKELPLR